MSTDFRNVYEDPERAAAYAQLTYPGTYYLAFRDVSEIVARHVVGASDSSPGKALDFGCGAGRSTRFVRDLGFQAVGVDISAQMISKARELDPAGDYRRIEDGVFPLPDASFDLALAAFTFDNIPTPEQKVRNFRELKRVLTPRGRLVVIVSSPELYTHDWASFRCTGFPSNLTAQNGDSVYTIMTDVPDARPVHDIRWDDGAYRGTCREAGLEVEAVYRPLGRPGEPYAWVSETTIAPWTIYVLT